MSLDVAAAQDALARSDDGLDPQPGDAELIAAYDQALTDAHDRWVAEQIAATEADYQQWWQTVFGDEGDGAA